MNKKKSIHYRMLFFYSYSCFRFGFIGNHPFNTRLRWSNTSLMVQKEEKANTPSNDEIRMLSTSNAPMMPKIPKTRNTHQQRVPQ